MDIIWGIISISTLEALNSGGFGSGGRCISRCTTVLGGSSLIGDNGFPLRPFDLTRRRLWCVTLWGGAGWCGAVSVCTR